MPYAQCFNSSYAKLPKNNTENNYKGCIILCADLRIFKRVTCVNWMIFDVKNISQNLKHIDQNFDENGYWSKELFIYVYFFFLNPKVYSNVTVKFPALIAK